MGGRSDHAAGDVEAGHVRLHRVSAELRRPLVVQRHASALEQVEIGMVAGEQQHGVRGHLDERLEPQQAARTVAHHLHRHAARGDR